MPPDGHGATALLMARLLAHFEIGRLDPMGAMRVHFETEAARLAYDARNRFLADPASMPQGLAPMLDARKVASLAALIDPQKADARRAQGVGRGASRSPDAPDGGLHSLVE